MNAANTITAIITVLVLAFALLLGVRLKRRLLSAPTYSPEVAKRIRTGELLFLGYFASLTIVGVAVWDVTGSALAGVMTSFALLVVAPFAFQVARPFFDHRIDAKKSREFGSDSH